MDLRKLKTLIDLVSESNISELEITEAEGKVRIVKASAPALHTSSPAAPAVVLPAAPVVAPPAPEAPPEAVVRVVKSARSALKVFLPKAPSRAPPDGLARSCRVATLRLLWTV